MGAARGCFVDLTKLTRGTVFNFFSGKMDQELVVFWSKTEVLGQFCVFSFLKRQLMTINDFSLDTGFVAIRLLVIKDN